MYSEISVKFCGIYFIILIDYTEYKIARLTEWERLDTAVYMSTYVQVRWSYTYFPRWVNEIPEIIQMERRSQRIPAIEADSSFPFRGWRNVLSDDLY